MQTSVLSVDGAAGDEAQDGSEAGLLAYASIGVAADSVCRLKSTANAVHTETATTDTEQDKSEVSELDLSVTDRF